MRRRLPVLQWNKAVPSQQSSCDAWAAAESHMGRIRGNSMSAVWGTFGPPRPQVSFRLCILCSNCWTAFLLPSPTLLAVFLFSFSPSLRGFHSLLPFLPAYLFSSNVLQIIKTNIKLRDKCGNRALWSCLMCAKKEYKTSPFPENGICRVEMSHP